MKNYLTFSVFFVLALVHISSAEVEESDIIPAEAVPGIRVGRDQCNCPPEMKVCGRGCACCKKSCEEIYHACLTNRVSAERVYYENLKLTHIRPQVNPVKPQE